MTYFTLPKVFILFSILCLLGKFAYSQETEIRVNAYSGLFFFRGNGSSSTATITNNPYLTPNYTFNDYGRKAGFSYSIEMQAQKIIKKKDIYGIAVSYEKLLSKVNNYILTESGLGNYPPNSSAAGKTTLANSFITLNPFTGHRFISRKFIIDLVAGLDLAFCLKSYEVAKVLSAGKEYVAFENNITKPSIDLRPRLQINTYYDNIGFLFGYSLGLTNFQTQKNIKAFTNFLRFGISYKLK